MFDIETYKILEIKTGSHLYGTNTPESDVDYCGVFIAPINYYFGLDIIKEADCSIVNKLESGKNSKEAVDRKFYEIRNFTKLAIENNPNLLEVLFVNKENIIYNSYLGGILLANKHLFPWKGLKEKYLGYSISQQKKMLVKSGNMKDLKNGLDFLMYLQKNELSKYIFEVESNLLSIFKDNGNQHLKLGDIYIQKNITIRKAIEQIQGRVDKFGNRKELVDEYGFDTKFAAHCVRLLSEGKDLLETGEIVFPLKQRELLLEIRNGKYSLDEVNEMIESGKSELEKSYVHSSLPSKPRYKEINDLLVNMMDNRFC